ncbi:MAG: hypothetical protein KC620_00060 [Myxococcales bacterium]|nr:hypothetical protein [Myxococcales bacterium]
MRGVIVIAAAISLGGCVKSMAVSALGDSLAGEGRAFAEDDDPELVRDASAFSLKLVESLLESEPEHPGLLLAATRGFTQYGFAFLQSEADYIQDDNLARAKVLRRRAANFYRRARAYGVRGLETEVEHVVDALRKHPKKTLDEFDEDFVPLLYWTAAAWSAAVALDKDNVEMAADLDLVEAMMARARALDPNYGAGAVHDWYVAYTAATPGSKPEDVKPHFDAAMAAGKQQRVSPLVAYAEGVCINTQDKEQFVALLERALAFDVDAAPRFRLANLIAQKRARWLLDHIDDHFI